MARNAEKQLTRLNRLLLEKEQEELLKKNPPRPHLGTLKTAEEIRKWLPSIKKDMEYYLMQSEVTCYPERKIEEFSGEIDRLRKEFNLFVRRLKELDPETVIVPWTDRAYQSQKRPAASETLVEAEELPSKKHESCTSDAPALQRLVLPVLVGREEALYRADARHQPVMDSEALDNNEPLCFSQSFMQRSKILAQRNKEKVTQQRAPLALAKARTPGEVRAVAAAHLASIRRSAEVDAASKTTTSVVVTNNGNNALSALAGDYTSSDSDT